MIPYLPRQMPKIHQQNQTLDAWLAHVEAEVGKPAVTTEAPLETAHEPMNPIPTTSDAAQPKTY